MNTKENIERLRAMLAPAGCPKAALPLSDEELAAVLTWYPCFELAAYHVCLRLAQNDATRLSDGTQTSSQENYWLRMARVFRPDAGRVVRRADDAEV